MLHPWRALHFFAQGQSYWRVILDTNRAWSQLDMVYDPLRGDPEKKYQRSLEWHEDLVATGDVRRIRELWLHTPIGDAALRVSESGTAYQLNAAGLLMDICSTGGGRQRDAQIIGRVDHKETGRGVAYIWDVHTRQLYKDEQASVLHFTGWRPGIADLGELAWRHMGVAL